MTMSMRTVVACAIPTAVAVIGFIFFWTRKKPDPDKKSEKLEKQSENASRENMSHSEQPQKVKTELSKPVQESSDSVIEEEIVCSVASSESAIAPSSVDGLQSAPAVDVQCDEYVVSKDDAVDHVCSDVTESATAASASTDEQCACPVSSSSDAQISVNSGAIVKDSLSALSDRKRVDSGLGESQEFPTDSKSVEPSSTSSKEKGSAERPDSNSIPLSPQRPLPADSPQNDHLNSSDSVSEASEVSNDSGKGTSVSENHVQINGEVHVYQFAFPSDLCGRLVGKHGRNINEIKDHSGAQITLLRQPFTKDTQICCLEGTEPEIQLALEIIKKRFPESRFPKINYDPIDASHPAQNPVLSPDLMQLKLPEGVSSDVIVSSIVDASHVFLQQPTHPAFPSLERLNQCMMTCYTQDLTVPPLPKPIEGGVICAAPIMSGWYRAQVMTLSENGEECDIRFLDYGGYSRVNLSDLRQIRSDFMTLPFQAVEAYVANISPLPDQETFSIESAAVMEELTQGHLLQAEILSYDEESGIPFVHLYRMSRDSMVFINRELVNRGVVMWSEA